MDQLKEKPSGGSQREEFFRESLRRSGWKVTTEVISVALAKIGIPRSTLFRLAALPPFAQLAFLQGGLKPAPPASISISDEIAAVSGLEEQSVFGLLGTSPEGLASLEAQVRLRTVGPNLVAQEARPTPLHEIWGSARNPLNALLLGLAAISYFLGDTNAAVVICVIVTLAISMAFVQEHRSNDAAAKLRAVVKTTATVRRRRSPIGEELTSNGFEEIPMEQLVPGDIVRLSAGDMIPGDLRLLKTKDLFVDQSTLSGEAMPVEKSAQSDGAATDPLNAPNICLMGCSVVSGFATGVIVHTGARTYFGELASRIAQKREPTSFDKGVNRFVRLMIYFMLALAPSVFLINGLTKGDWLQALLFALAVAVGLTPELLPMIVTVNLAKGAIAMAKKRVIVKRLNAIQNFGAMDVLCADKTGTLTENRVSLHLHLNADGKADERVLEYAYLNSHYQSGLKSLLDFAVLNHVETGKNLRLRHNYESVDEIPFDFIRKRLSVIVRRHDGAGNLKLGLFAKLRARLTGALLREGGAHLLICKGAIEETLSICAYIEIDGTLAKLDWRRRARALAMAHELNEDGLRVVAVAYKEFAQAKETYSVEDEADLVLLGFIAFLDPPKESCGAAIASLRANGVAVKILTGDNEIVTRKICREVGLEADRFALGPEIEKLTDHELADFAEATTIFAKLSPDQKARIVRALHIRGHVVGFLGDGINDSLALKAADVGISVDCAVDIAKESADIILLEKDLTILQQGVVEGRKVFGNIVKYIKMGASSNFGSMFSVLGASLFLPFLPMQPIQVLTNNLLYDFSQTAIPTDDVDEDYLAAPRRWDIDNIFKFMLLLGPISSIFDYTTFFVMFYVFDGWANPSLFQTGWFVESLISQTLIIHIIRTAKVPFFESRASATLIAASVIICGVAAALPFTSLGEALKFAPLPPLYWPILAATLLAYGTLAQLVKVWFFRRWGM
ncbi:HAD-IC family P-type ATPase [Methylocystis sp. MJC1]|uniref:HAD-IC family P-type ATPase n=1 Tax=Methylocystis sp. MJC1 TaxID=2654282 RepID=UPI001FF01DAB|nr:HAD-IC family P-type ATPase [Methylocystis sp. MJC1]